MVFVANSTAIVGTGEVGNIPLTYLDRRQLFPTPESPTNITI
jgi:hypothetical protein